MQALFVDNTKGVFYWNFSYFLIENILISHLYNSKAF